MSSGQEFINGIRYDGMIIAQKIQAIGNNPQGLNRPVYLDLELAITNLMAKLMHGMEDFRGSADVKFDIASVIQEVVVPSCQFLSAIRYDALLE